MYKCLRVGLLVGLPLLSTVVLGQEEKSPQESCRELQSIVLEVGARLKKNLQVDPRVRGCVQVRVDTAKMSYRDVQALLALHGYIDTMELDGVVQIIPESGARLMPMRLIDDGTRGIGEFEMVMKIVDTTPLNAAHLVPILRPLLSQYSHLVADTETNSLIVVTRYANLRTLETLLRGLRGRQVVDKYKQDAAPSAAAAR